MISNRDLYILLVFTIVSSLVALSLYSGGDIVLVEQTKPFVPQSSVQFDDIQSISIQKDESLLEFEKHGDVWYQQTPFKYRMDSASMMSVIRAVQGARSLGEVDPSTDLSTVGLGIDSNSISISDGNRELTIFFGRKTLGGRAYARLGDAPPVFIDQSIHRTVLDNDSKRWRDARLFPEFSVDGIRIDRQMNGNRLLLDRTDGRWQMIEPVTVEVNENLLFEWVGRIAGARVKSFVVDTPTDLTLFDLLDPIASFSTQNLNGEIHTLFVGGRVSAGSQDRYVMLEGKPVVSKVSWEILSPLFPAPEIFVDATGSSISRFDIKQITIRSDLQEVVIERNLDRWMDINGNTMKNESVDNLLTWLLDTNSPTVSIGPFPKELEVATVVFSGYDLMPLDAVRIAQLNDGRFVLENGDNVLRLHASKAGESLLLFITK